MSTNHLTNTRFDSLEINNNLKTSLKEAGFEFCTPVQAMTLPKALMGTNLMGQARTGSGKTLAFLIAAIQRLLSQEPKKNTSKGTPVRALILAPTRELAVQIEKDAQALLKGTGLTMALAYGGENYEKQRDQIQKNADLLIGTPGRLIDYFKQQVFNLKCIDVLVLDEADRMLDLGFIKDIRFLLRRMSPAEERLNLLFSATLSYRVIELAYEHMNAPVVVNAEENEAITTENIEQTAYYPSNREKIPLLLGLFNALKPERAIVFVNTKIDADRVTRYLIGNDYNAQLLSGDVPQKKRQRLVIEFEKGDLPVLVATDVAARGLHIPEVSHVFNYDLPQDAEDYVHRIGRTGRIGHKGKAVSLVCETFAFSLPDIEEYIGQKIKVESISPELLIEPKPPIKAEKRPGHKSNRKGGKAGSHSEGARKKRPRRRPGSGAGPQNNPGSKANEAK